MTAEILISLIGFALAASLTPGPNNSMIASSGATYGIRASVPHMLGIFCGFPVMIFLVGIGLGNVFESIPGLQVFLRYGGVLMLLWMAWKIATAEAPGSPNSSAKPLTFFQSATFQWINPKGLIVATAITSQFVTAQEPLKSTLVVAAVFFFAGLISSSVWLVFGRMIGKWLRTPGRLRVFNLIMAAMLIGFLLVILFGQ